MWYDSILIYDGETAYIELEKLKTGVVTVEIENFPFAATTYEEMIIENTNNGYGYGKYIKKWHEQGLI